MFSYYANRILNFLIAMVKKNVIIPTSINVSFQTPAMPSPFIMTDFTIMKNHFAGTIFEIMRKGNGIFSTGNINPLSISVGRNNAINEMNIAVCWDAAPEEINKPSDNDTSVNRMLSNPSNTILPLIGTSRANTLNNNMEVILIVDNNKYGTAFARTTNCGRIGETSIISMVPISFSFTMVMAVIIVHTNNKTIAITPGTKLNAPFSCGL